LWLLHYQLVKSGIASIYSIIFNEFRKEKLFFNKETYSNYIKRIGESNPDLNFNENRDYLIGFKKPTASSIVPSGRTQTRTLAIDAVETFAGHASTVRNASLVN
jgi:hypothetical protein